MEYNININQKAIIELSPEININEAASVSYVYRICTSKSTSLERIKVNDEIYTWFNLKHFMNEMPLLKIKSKGTASRIITNIENYGLVKKYRKSDRGSKLYITYTEKLDSLFTDRKKSV